MEQTVEVQFPDGPRRIRAKMVRFSGCDFSDRRFSSVMNHHIEPEDMKGWRFHEAVGGQWIATSDI